MYHRSSITLQNTPEDGFSRRNFLSLPLVAGSVMLFERVARADLTARFVQENLEVTDSLTLYINLLPEVRRSREFSSLYNFTETLKSKYVNFQSESTVRKDFSELLNQVHKTDDLWLYWTFNEPERRASAVAATINAVHSSLLKSSESFSSARSDNTNRSKLVKQGKDELNKAIELLQTLVKNPFDETKLNGPTERLIVLLRGVQFALDKTLSAADRRSPATTYTSHHAASPAFRGIMDVLITHVKPGSWLQLAIGYSVSFPILLRNGPDKKDLRLKLLFDALRLVPGLVPQPLVDAAQELAALSL